MGYLLSLRLEHRNKERKEDQGNIVWDPQEAWTGAGVGYSWSSLAVLVMTMSIGSGRTARV